MTCEVNKPNVKARWFKDNVELKPSDILTLTVDGTTHSLTIPKADLEDEAEYTIKLENKSSTALLLVEGSFRLINNTYKSLAVI